MTVLIALESVLLAALTVLVAGLLRAYGTVLRRLHALDGGRSRDFALEPAAAASVDTPQRRDSWTTAHDVAGETIGGELVSTQVVGVDHDTVLLFLSSGCASCAIFWDELRFGVSVPEGTRLLVIAQGSEFDDPSALAALAPSNVDVLMSTQAWRDYEVPGSPHVVYVEARTGRIRGEGTGQSWSHVADLLARASGDPTFVGALPRQAKPARDAEVEARIDRELMAAGIMPGDPRLYGDNAPWDVR